jgi:hypothetical protein
VRRVEVTKPKERNTTAGIVESPAIVESIVL